MRKILGNIITIISELIICIIAISWYLENCSKEALIVAISSFVALIFSIFFRSRKSKNDTQEWYRQIDVYKNNINRFKPKTALSLLLELEKSFDLNENRPTDKIKATIEFLKAQCYNFINNNDEAYKCHLSAYKLDPTSKLFKEQACYTYYKLTELPQAKKLVEELLQEDEFNSLAYVVKILVSDNSDLDSLIADIPIFVRKDKNFRRILYFNTYTNPKFTDQQTVYDKYAIIPDISEYDDTNVTIDNYKDKMFWIESKLSEYIRTLNFDFKKVYKGNLELLKFIKKVISQFIDGIAESEIKDNYKMLYFFNKYADNVIEDNKEAVLEMKIIYSNLNNKPEYITLILANSLQIIGEDEYAIQIINSAEAKTSELLYLESFCYIKKKDIVKYILSVKNFLSTVDYIDLLNIENIINIQITLFSYYKQDQIDIKEFIEDKEFEFPYLKILLESFHKVTNKQSNLNPITDLQKIEDEILKTKSTIIFYIAYSYYILEKYNLAKELFEKYISKEVESRDLFYYIISLDKSRTNHTELLFILEKWRKKFSFNGDLLRIEADLRRQISDWEKCLEVSEYFLTKNDRDEAFLTLELITLNELEREYKKDRIAELALIFENFEFDFYQHALVVSNILVQHAFYNIALEILYKKANLLGNKQARMDFFLMSMQMPEGLIKEKKIVETGCYVKYSLNNEIKTIFIDAESTLAKKLIGHKKDDTISIQRPLTNLIDSIQVILILDKYLFLLNEISDEVKSNPYSDIPMQSIEIKELTPESLKESLISQFGANGSLVKENHDNAYKEYYNYRLSFTEIIVQNYSSDYLGGYFHLTYAKDGITQVPLVMYPAILIDSQTEFVIDYSSLLILYQIFKEHKVKFNHKFIISKGIVDNIKVYLKKERSEPKVQMFLDITLEGITKIIKPEDSSEKNIKYIEGLLDWIGDNCEVKIVESKLDLLRNIEGNIKNNNIISYLIENITLVIEEKNRIIITDDSIYLRFFPKQMCNNISSELYVKTSLNPADTILYEFIKNKYIGYTITTETLLSEFNKKMKEQPNLYSHCINNTSLRLLPNKSTIFTIIRFLKQLALNPILTNDVFKLEAMNALINLLKGQKEAKPFKITELLIKKEFELLGNKYDLMIESYTNALAILAYKPQ